MYNKASLMDFVTHFEIMPLDKAYFGLFADDDPDDRSMTVTAPAVDDRSMIVTVTAPAPAVDDPDNISLIGE